MFRMKRSMEIDCLYSLICCTWISIERTKYHQIKMVLTLDVNESSLPKYGIIDNIFLILN